MADSWRVSGRISRDPRLRRLELGFLGFSIAEQGTWLAGILYAYERGGVDEAGVATVLLLIPGIVVAPLSAFASDRFDAGRVLAAGYAIQSTSMLLAAGAIASDRPALIVYAALMVAASAVTLTRPTIGAVLPSATRTAADLTAANVVIGFVEYSGMLIGPALTGALVSASGTAAPFAVGGGLTGVAALLALRIHTSPEGGTPVDGTARRRVVADTLDGLHALRNDRAVRAVIGMLSLGAVVSGAADILVVATAAHLEGGDTSRAGILGTAFGVGAVIGSVFTVLLIGRARLTPSIAMGVGAMGLSLAVLSTAGRTPLAMAVFVVMGAGASVLRVASATLIQRIAPHDVVGRFLGVVEGLHMLSLAIGSGMIGLLVVQLGYEHALLVAGVVVPLLLLVRSPALFRIDRDARVPDGRVLELILGDDIFGGLPAPTIERLAADATRVRAVADEAIVLEGTTGDRYYVVDDGVVEVTLDGVSLRFLGPGDGFGELALLGDAVRTATVTATGPVELLSFGREQFLSAVTGHQRSAAVGRERTHRYLGPPAS